MYAAALATCALLLGIATHGVLATDCIGDPSQPSCAGYVYREAGQDVDSLCGMMPGMVGCELKEACGSDTRGFCHPFSLLADICRSDKGDMGGMMGCHNYVALCSKNSTVAECTRPGPVPRFVTSSAARNAAVMMCASMPAMQGCKSCTNATGGCKAPLTSLSQVCRGMPGMHMCAPIEHMCDDLASTPALASALCEGLSTRVHDNPDASFCTDGTVMYMSGFVWEFEGNTCPVLLLPEWALNTRLKYYLGLLIVILMGFGSEALAYLRRTTAAGGGALTCCAPQSVMLRQGLDSTLHVMQIGTGYCLMLVAMTYHIPLFACVLIGLGLGHCFFAHRKVDGLSAGLGGRPEPCCPDTGPILAMGTQQPGSIQDAGVASPVNESLEAGLLERDRRAGRRSSTALDLAAQVRLQVDGMTCGACVKRVQAALKEVDTIDFFDVTLGPPGSARIVCKDRDDGSSSAADEDSVAAAAIAAIEGTGFSARVAGAVLEGAE